MSEKPSQQKTEEDPYAETNKWIAAQGRQLFRALSAFDPKAVEVCLFYLSNYLVKVLGGHLRRLHRWDIEGLWFDGLDAPELNVGPPWCLRINAWLVCVARQGESEDWWREPFEFELRLCAQSGRFRGYRFRVGDHRPHAEKKVIGLEVGMSKRIQLDPFRIVVLPSVAPSPVGGWLEEIHRGDFPLENQ